MPNSVAARNLVSLPMMLGSHCILTILGNCLKQVCLDFHTEPAEDTITLQSTCYNLHQIKKCCESVGMIHNRHRKITMNFQFFLGFDSFYNSTQWATTLNTWEYNLRCLSWIWSLGPGSRIFRKVVWNLGKPGPSITVGKI